MYRWMWVVMAVLIATATSVQAEPMTLGKFDITIEAEPGWKYSAAMPGPDEFIEVTPDTTIMLVVSKRDCSQGATDQAVPITCAAGWSCAFEDIWGLGQPSLRTCKAVGAGFLRVVHNGKLDDEPGLAALQVVAQRAADAFEKMLAAEATANLPTLEPPGTPFTLHAPTADFDLELPGTYAWQIQSETSDENLLFELNTPLDHIATISKLPSGERTIVDIWFQLRSGRYECDDFTLNAYTHHMKYSSVENWPGNVEFAYQGETGDKTLFLSCAPTASGTLHSMILITGPLGDPPVYLDGLAALFDAAGVVGKDDDNANFFRFVIGLVAVSPSNEIASTTYGGRIGIDAILDVSGEGGLNPLLGVGGTLGLDSGLHLLFDARWYTGAGVWLHGIRFAVLGVLGVERTGPDTGDFKGFGAYVGGQARIGIPLAVVELDAAVDWNTSSMRGHAGLALKPASPTAGSMELGVDWWHPTGDGEYASDIFGAFLAFHAH